MNRSLFLLLVLHIFSASDAKVVNCSYINGKTDSVLLNCESDYIYVDYPSNPFASDENENVPANKENTAIRDGECYSDLFKSESKEKNSLNVRVLKTTMFCNTDAIRNQFSNIHELDISSTGDSYTTNLLQFRGLTKVNASHNHFSMLDFAKLNFWRNLTEYDLSYNRVQTLFAGLISKHTQLTVINLSHNELESLIENQFAWLTMLRELDLSYNRIYFIHMNAFQSNPNLKLLRLENNPLTIFDCDMFLPINQLTSVTVTFDNIDQIMLQCANFTIDFASDNPDEMIIQSAKIKTPLRFKKEIIKKLIYFGIGENEMKNISQIIELLPSSLKALDIKSSKLNQQNVKIIERFTQMDILYLTHSSLTDLEPQMFSNKSELRMLGLSYNRMKIRDPKAVFAHLGKMQALLISDAHLENTQNVIKALPSSTTQLDVSLNNLGKIDATTFQHLNNLQLLNLSHTNLSNFGFDTFYHQTKLISLDLSYNKLMKVNFTLFAHNFLELTHLNLEGNNLSDIKTITSTVFPKLTTLAISKNQLLCHDLVAFFYQWKTLNVIGNPSNQTHIKGIDCDVHVDPNAEEKEMKKTKDANGVHTLTPSDHEIIVKHTLSHVTMYFVLFLCVICGGYLVVKSKLIPRIKSKLTNSLASNGRRQQAASTLVLMKQENL